LRYISSPSVSSSGESWQEFLQPANQQNGIPVDPVILTNNGPWETEDERQHIHADGDAVISEIIYQYPDPPLLPRDTRAENRNSNAYPEAQEGSSRSDSPPHNQSHAPVSADNNPEAHIRASSSPLGVPTSGQQSKTRKRKLQQSHGQPQLCKRVRGSSSTALKKNSFSSLCSDFTSVSVDERLQFLSWLFEGALPRCVSESDPKEPDRVARPAHRWLDQLTGSTEFYGTSRKGMPWSSEEVNLLLRLRRDEKRTWSDVTRIFSEQFPGRSQGSIQVFWSSALKNRAH
jgi:chitinase